MTNLSNTCRISKEGVFIYSGGDHLTAEDVISFIGQNEKDNSAHYMRNFDYYTGKHSILSDLRKTGGRPDNRIVVNAPHYLVDTYNGYFIGKSPKLALNDDEGNTVADDKPFQNWLNTTNFIDKLAELSKDVDIYGKSFIFCYQNEDSETKIAITDPTDSFVIYDDEITPHLLAYVRYFIDNDGVQNADVYYADRQDHLESGKLTTVKDTNIYGAVPAVEFYESSERQGVFDTVISLVDELDHALSQKANQVEYFDNAYMKILGLHLDDDSLQKLATNHLLYAPDAEAAKANVGFIEKPDGDNMQENLLTRVSDLIYQISHIPNLRDKDFSGNSSGVALEYKMLSMQNKAANKEHQFKHALRALFKVLFSIDTIVHNSDDWQNLNMTFYRNAPQDLETDASIAKDLTGIVSQKTLFKILPFVDNPDTEIKQIQKEQGERVQSMMTNSDNLYDYQKKPENNDDLTNSTK